MSHEKAQYTPALALLTPAQLAALSEALAEERQGCAAEPASPLGYWPTAVAALLVDVEGLTDRVKRQQGELADQEKHRLLLIQETHRWSAAVKMLEAERAAPAETPALYRASGYKVTCQNLAQRCAKCKGVVNAYGQCFYCDTTEPGLCN